MNLTDLDPEDVVGSVVTDISRTSDKGDGILTISTPEGEMSIFMSVKDIQRV